MGFLTTHNAFRSSPPLLRKESSGCFTKPLILGAGGIDIAHELLLTAPVHTRIIELPPGTHAGLTLSSRGRGPGVTVSSLVMRDQAARCGLAIGDVILSIDGQPVHDPADGTRAIDSKRGLSGSAGRATLTILPRADAGYQPPPLAKKHSSSQSLPIPC